MAAATDAERATPAKTADSFIGSFICLVSKSDIRYEGFLFHLDPHDTTIGLRHVKSFGTEGRRKDGSQVSASDKIYDYIFFRGSDIKDLQVISSPSAQSTSSVPDDPAIIQSHYPHPSPSTMGSTSHGAAKVKNVSTSVLPIIPVTPFQLNQPHDRSSFWGTSLPPPVNISRLAVPNYFPGLAGSSGGVSHLQQHHFPPPPQILVASHPLVQQQAQHQNANTPITGGSSSFEHHHPLLLRGSPNTLPPLLPTPSFQSNPRQFAKLVSTLSSIPMPNNGSSSLSSVAMDPAPKVVSSLPVVVNANPTPAPVTNEPSSVDPKISQTISSHVEMTGVSSGVSFSKQSKLSPMTIEEQSGWMQSSSPQSLQTTYVDAKTALSSVMEPLPSDCTEEALEPLQKSTTKTMQGSTSSHRYKGQLARGRDQAHRDPAFTNHSYRRRAQGRANVANGVALYTHQRSRNHAVGRGDGFQPDGVPPRNPGYAGSHFRGRGAKNPPVIKRFKEDFDFEAMNEKFNKEEVWDSLGKSNKAEADDRNEDDKKMDDYDVQGEAREVHVNKPVYCKDGFFDSLSCDGPDHESAKVKHSEQRKKNVETFGVEIPILRRGHDQGACLGGTSQVSYRGKGQGHGTARGGHGRGEQFRGSFT